MVWETVMHDVQIFGNVTYVTRWQNMHWKGFRSEKEFICVMHCCWILIKLLKFGIV